MICREAGGGAIDGRRDILDVTPQELHQRTPLYIGSLDLVERARALVGSHSEF
jgi:fructose-1,6-bisphosphatase I